MLLPALAIHFDLDDGTAGKSWERLYQDTHRVGGQCPHPVSVQKAQVPVLATRVGPGAVAGLLREPVDNLRAELQEWSVRYRQNEPLLQQIQSMLTSLPPDAREGCVSSL